MEGILNMMTNISRIIIETLVRKAIRDMKDSPERSSRNLVDMAMQFAKGRFQKHFFSTAQTMLQNENSPYYKLIADLVTYTDTERMIKFGMNIGYNSCTLGAHIIRETEDMEQFNIPWNICLKLSPSFFKSEKERYHTLIHEGESLGIYTWILFFEEYHHSYLTLANRHTDSAFILFCPPSQINTAFLDDLNGINNIMIAVSYDDNLTERELTDACRLLREHGIPFSLYSMYSDDSTESILNDDLLYCTQQYHPIFTVLVPDRTCSEDTRQAVYQYVKTTRSEQQFQTIPWDLFMDGMFVDTIISEDSCQAVFDHDGAFLFPPQYSRIETINIFHSDLKSILKNVYPKQADLSSF